MNPVAPVINVGFTENLNQPSSQLSVLNGSLNLALIP
jgi:hypothetical protein